VLVNKGRLMIGRRFQQEPPPVIAQPVAGIGRLRKIALIGSANTVHLAPWYDPTWEIWAHATVYPYCKRVDRFFDLHPWKWISEKPVPGYLAWLKTLHTPIYMQRKFRDVPASVRFPKERVMAEHPRYFTSHAAWMIALALTEGVTHLGFYGIHYALDEEHKKQRTGCEFWMGVAHGRGVQIVNPEGSPLIREPKWLYGYESHDGKTHIREKTGGKKPGTNTNMDVPPQDIPMTPLPDDATVEQVLSYGRTDIPCAEDRLQAMLSGQPPIDPRTKQLAW
jgi:hypothetical protein